MFEAQKIHTLETPLGDLIFGPNPFRPYALFTSISSEASVRRTVDSLPQADGGVVGDGYSDVRVTTYTGHSLGADDATAQTQAQQIRGYINRLLRADGVMKWTPSGYPPVQMTVRRWERPVVEGGRGVKKDMQLSFVSADPRVYEQEADTVDVGLTIVDGFTSPFTSPFVQSGAGVESTATNTGDADTPIVACIYGPASNPVLLNATTGKLITFQGLTIDDGQYVEIDTAQKTVRLNGSEAADRYQFYVAASSSMWMLEPGDNQIRLVVSSGSGVNTRATIEWRNAWMP